MGTVTLSAELEKQLADGVDEELAGTDLAVLTTQRDALLLCLLEQKAAIDARKIFAASCRRWQSLFKALAKWKRGLRRRNNGGNGRPPGRPWESDDQLFPSADSRAR